MFSQRVITPWNALPKKCVNSHSIHKYKSSHNDAWKDHPEKFSCVQRQLLRTTPQDYIYEYMKIAQELRWTEQADCFEEGLGNRKLTVS